MRAYDPVNEIPDGAAILRPGKAALSKALGQQDIRRCPVVARCLYDRIQQLDRCLDARRRCHRTGSTEASATRRIIGRLARDRDVVHMAFAQAGIGDPHKARALLKVGYRA